MDRLKDLDGQISSAINKVKALKEEKNVLENRISELERKLNDANELLNRKNDEIEKFSGEKVAIKTQIEDLLKELESIEVN